jgi:hypothetical protein
VLRIPYTFKISGFIPNVVTTGTRVIIILR